MKLSERRQEFNAHNQGLFQYEFGYENEIYERAEELRKEGAIVWVRPEYGSNMSGYEEYMGERLVYITLGALTEHVAKHAPAAV